MQVIKKGTKKNYYSRNIKMSLTEEEESKPKRVTAIIDKRSSLLFFSFRGKCSKLKVIVHVFYLLSFATALQMVLYPTGTFAVYLLGIQWWNNCSLE